MPAPPDRDDVTTTSDLVRRFGRWRARAARSPVYILYRGRPRFVLASIELIDVLQRWQRERDDRTSLDESFILSRDAAIARIDRHGFIEGEHTALAALSGISASMLSTLRFVTLFALPTRRAVVDLIAAVEADGTPRSGTAHLLTDAGGPRQVTVSLAPRRHGTAIHGVMALILAVN